MDHLVRHLLLAAMVLASPCADAAAGAPPRPVLVPGSHACGGIGDEERAAMDLSRDLYDLRLSFAESGTGAYVTGVFVMIDGVGGAPSFGPFPDCGPLLHVALPPGNYRVQARYAGITRAQMFRVRRGPTLGALYWPAQPD